ncbi:glutamate--tRNA ligase [Mycoplasma sp. Ms02]|uniref:glutamate--tRNA ligase n=1 Tax=Mycoplasma sp. Ms02 TaxID=353851 RepID=UPI001C8A277A|nr:glutamate--tRNA ligase [Mycoplasma sp. Ms02]QZE12558.1 glutamate--tRNA ligase [Mycoplasma sp. Ms02]
MKKIRTRYAPSPTGYLHVGGARTALFCYLFAKHFNGDFIFRLEDTDFKRNVEGGEASQLDNLAWLGIVPDESPLNPNPKYGNYRQSEKLERYRKIADELIEKGFAYKAYDNSEELDAQKAESDAKGIPSFRFDRNWLKISDSERQRRDEAGEYSIRFSMPKDVKYSWNDIVRGEITFDSSEIGDWVIYKSDGYPTYNFAVVIDDHDMEITNVLRGEEHIGNTPKQLAIFDALGWDHPEYGHMTIITNMEGVKLSKRDTSLKQFIEDYKNEGYDAHAVFNFLALLGWTSADAKEVMSKEELIEKFDPKRLSKSPSKFDIQKMQWFSKQYIKKTDNQEIIEKLEFKKTTNFSDEWLDLFVETYKQSIYKLDELKDQILIYVNPSQEPLVLYDEEKAVANHFSQLLNNQSDFSVESVQAAITQTQNDLNIKGKKLFMPIRKAATFQEHGPELAKAIFLFGKDLVLERLK